MIGGARHEEFEAWRRKRREASIGKARQLQLASRLFPICTQWLAAHRPFLPLLICSPSFFIDGRPHHSFASFASIPMFQLQICSSRLLTDCLAFVLDGLAVCQVRQDSSGGNSRGGQQRSGRHGGRSGAGAPRIGRGGGGRKGSKSETAEEVIALGPRGIFQTTLERDPAAAVWEERRPGSRGDDWRESTYMWFASAPRDPQRHGDLTGDRPGGLSPDYDLGWRPREAAAHPLSHVVATHRQASRSGLSMSGEADERILAHRLMGKRGQRPIMVLVRLLLSSCRLYLASTVQEYARWVPPNKAICAISMID